MKRPWNIIDSPIYSLKTEDENGNINMNICTYVSVVSMKPKMYAIAIDYKTKTFDNLEMSSEAVLQILSFDNISLVKKLGKKSGKKINKNNYLKDNLLLQEWKGEQVLNGSCAFLKLKKSSCICNHGDHVIYLFDVITFKTIAEDNILTFQDLVKHKIIL
jgi:flavin reductase (DIM6/NTAB) family NADH-FMN oxidoreductase RutF